MARFNLFLNCMKILLKFIFLCFSQAMPSMNEFQRKKVSILCCRLDSILFSLILIISVGFYYFFWFFFSNEIISLNKLNASVNPLKSFEEHFILIVKKFEKFTNKIKIIFYMMCMSIRVCGSSSVRHHWCIVSLFISCDIVFAYPHHIFIYMAYIYSLEFSLCTVRVNTLRCQIF